MTIPKLIDAFKYLQSQGLMNESLTDEELEKIAIHALKLMEEDHWTDKFFPPSTTERCS